MPFNCCEINVTFNRSRYEEQRINAGKDINNSRGHFECCVKELFLIKIMPAPVLFPSKIDVRIHFSNSIKNMINIVQVLIEKCSQIMSCGFTFQIYFLSVPRVSI